MSEASRHVLDCSNIHAAVSFDTLCWFVLCEMIRRKYHGPAPLKIKFANVPDAKKEWIEKVLRPLLPLLGAVEDDTIERGEFQAPFLSPENVTHDISDLSLQGYEVPCLSTGTQSRHGKVVITLRERDFWSHRNSNVKEWLRYAEHLEDSGESVIFVRDTRKANEPLDGFAIDPKAAVDIFTRMQLYEGAKMNFFCSNGPGGMTVFSRLPYRFFQVQYAGTRNPFQWPWKTKDQMLVYQKDSFDNLVKCWK